ncbi:MAG: hypothetical protein HPY57_15375 [Ignavibacteria bacterium]|nr:hypothetical protein [Ignavibacteria bacterium]
MKKELIKEKESLLQWLQKIMENNPEEIENYQMKEYIEKQIEKIEKQIENND